MAQPPSDHLLTFKESEWEGFLVNIRTNISHTPKKIDFD